MVWYGPGLPKSWLHHLPQLHHRPGPRSSSGIAQGRDLMKGNSFRRSEGGDYQDSRGPKWSQVPDGPRGARERPHPLRASETCSWCPSPLQIHPSRSFKSSFRSRRHRILEAPPSNPGGVDPSTPPKTSAPVLPELSLPPGSVPIPASRVPKPRVAVRAERRP